MEDRSTRETVQEEYPYLLADYWLDRYNEGKVALAEVITRLAGPVGSVAVEASQNDDAA